ncbi:MAG: hypothetical protein ABI137_00250, partial [Antricoccus sp.]
MDKQDRTSNADEEWFAGLRPSQPPEARAASYDPPQIEQDDPVGSSAGGDVHTGPIHKPPVSSVPPQRSPYPNDLGPGSVIPPPRESASREPTSLVPATRSGAHERFETPQAQFTQQIPVSNFAPQSEPQHANMQQLYGQSYQSPQQPAPAAHYPTDGYRAQHQPAPQPLPAAPYPQQPPAAQQPPADPPPQPPHVQQAPAPPPQQLTAADLTPQSLVKPETEAPKSGWRRAVFKVSGGSVNPGPSKVEADRDALIERVRTPIRGCHKIAVVSLKGGIGKTTTTSCLGLTLAHYRGD